VERLDWRPAAVQQSRGMFAICYLCGGDFLPCVRDFGLASGHPLDARQAAFDIDLNDAGGFVDSAHKTAVAVTDFTHGPCLFLCGNV